MWTGLSVCNRSVTGSLPFGSSQRLGRYCLWLAGLPSRWIGSAEVPLRHHLLLAVSSSESHEVTLSSQLTGMHLLSGASMIWSYPWILHCVGTLYGQMAEVYWLIWTCVYMIRVSCVFRQLVAFNPAVHRTASASTILLTDSDIFLLLTRIYQGTRTGDRQIA